MTEQPNEIEVIYGELLSRLMRADRAKDIKLGGRLYDAITLLEEIWPMETARWQARWRTRDTMAVDHPPANS